jgi:hypothetical protein
LILRKQVGKVCTGFIWLRIGTSVCEFWEIMNIRDP